MPIKIFPHSEEHTPQVKAFNSRMRAGGSKWGFYANPEPDWLADQNNDRTWREFFLAVDEGGIVRGGYGLKPQLWKIKDKTEWVTDWQGPFTEAEIDAKYSPLMLILLRGILKEHPFLFSLGHGGIDEPILQMLHKMKWGLWGIPFVLNVCRPFPFLRKNKFLRSSKMRRLALDILAFTGLGYLGINFLQMANKIRSSNRRRSLTTTIVDDFGSWTDELWQKNKDAYTCLAVRDRNMMNALMPQEGWPGGTRLKFCDASGEVVGWSIVHPKQFTDDPRFGALHVGLITDCFGAPEDAASIMAATHAYLTAKNVDLIFANVSHPAWIKGLQSNGYTKLEDMRIFALSPKLQDALSPRDTIAQGLHLTNMDGHGPHGFTEKFE